MIFVEYNVNYLQGNYFFMKKMRLTLINLTDPCTEVLYTSFLFYINMFNLCNFNKKYLIAETKMNYVSLKALKYSFDVDFICLSLQ